MTHLAIEPGPFDLKSSALTDGDHQISQYVT